MTLEDDELGNMLGKLTVVAMIDGGKFSGKLLSVGDNVIVLTDVLEMAEHGKWIKPTISTASFADVISASKTTMEMDERGFLERVIIYKSHILRLWPWEPKSLGDYELNKKCD
jgi:hypothetical protein